MAADKYVSIGFLLTQACLLLGFKWNSPLYLIGLILMSIASYKAVNSSSSIRFESLFSRRYFLFLWVVTVTTWTCFNFVEYYSIEYSNFDTGIFANLISNLVHTGSYFSSVLRTHGFADHFSLNLFLLAPLFKLYSSFLWLPFVKLLAFAVCPYLLILIAREVLGKDSKLVYIAPILWLSHCYIERIMEFEFQPSIPAMPFILLAFLFVIRKQIAPLFLVLLFLLGFKENMALVWVSVGSFLFFIKSQKKLGTTLVVLGIIAGLTVTRVIMPIYLEGMAYPHLIKLAPMELWLDKAILIAKGFLSFGLIPLLVPKALFFILPAYSIALLSGDPALVSFTYHYQDLPLTVSFVGLILGLEKLQTLQFSLKIKTLSTTLLVLFLILFHVRFPMRTIKKHWPQKNELELVHEIESWKQANSAMLSKADDLYALEFLGPYFFDHPNLRTIMRLEEISDSQSCKLYLMAENVETWPLSQQDFAEAKKRLEASLSRIENDKLLLYSSSGCK